MGFYRCKDCQGTGKVSCEVHLDHVCFKCNGKGCDYDGSIQWKYMSEPCVLRPHPSQGKIHAENINYG